MTPGHPYGTPLGLLAMLGYIVWMVAVFIFVVFGCAMGVSMWAGMPYSIAFGMGVWQLIIILWGSGRILYPVPIHRSIEFPADHEWPLSPAPVGTPPMGASTDLRPLLP